MAVVSNQSGRLASLALVAALLTAPGCALPTPASAKAAAKESVLALGAQRRAAAARPVAATPAPAATNVPAVRPAEAPAPSAAPAATPRSLYVARGPATPPTLRAKVAAGKPVGLSIQGDPTLAWQLTNAADADVARFKVVLRAAAPGGLRLPRPGGEALAMVDEAVVAAEALGWRPGAAGQDVAFDLAGPAFTAFVLARLPLVQVDLELAPLSAAAAPALDAAGDPLTLAATLDVR